MNARLGSTSSRVDVEWALPEAVGSAPVTADAYVKRGVGGVRNALSEVNG
jgi:hypothetical protein